MSTNKNNNDLDTNFNPLEHHSFSSKSKKGFKDYSEKSAQFIDSMINLQTERKKNAKLYVNYGLINGRDIFNDKNIQKLVGIDLLKKYSITKGNKKLKYIPLVDQVVKFIYGQQLRRPFNPTFLDKSDITKNEFKEKRESLQKNFLRNVLMPQIQQQAALEYQAEYGAINPSALSIEDQMQLRSEIEQRVEAMTPPEIKKFMKYKFRSGIEKDGQVLLDIISEKFHIKFKTDNNIINLIASGMEIYYNGIRNNKVTFEAVSPIGFNNFGNKEDIFIENSDMIRREREISFIDIFKNHGANIDTATYKKLLKLNSLETDNTGQLMRFAKNSVTSPEYGEVIDSQVITPFGGLPTSDVTKYKEHAYEYGELNLNKYTTERHYTWVTLREMYEITRMVGDKIEIFYRDSSYKKNSNRKDIDVKKVMASEVYETFALGSGEGVVYLSSGLAPFQYPSMYDPFTVKQPYSGIKYNLTMGKAEDIAPIDFAKPYILKTLISEKKLEDAEMSDKGKIAVFSDEASSDYSDIGEITESMEKYHAIRLNTKGVDIEAGGTKTSRIRDLVDILDLSTDGNQDRKIQKIEHYFNLMAGAIGADPRLMNMADRYVSKDVRENTVIQSSYKSEGLFGIHNMAVETTLLNFMNNAISNLNDNEQLELITFNGTERMLQEINVPNIKNAIPHIVIRSTNDDIDKLELSRDFVLRYISNSKIQLLLGLRLIWAKTKSEILEIAEEAQQAALEQFEREQQQLMERTQAINESKLKEKEIERQTRLDVADKNIERSTEYANIMVQQQERQFDIDRDGKNDMEKMQDKKIVYQKEKDALEYDIELKKLELKREEMKKEFEILMKKLNK